MRRSLRKYLPVFVIALMVQLFAPIGASWAAVINASDPLSNAGICHNASAETVPQDGRGDRQSDHGNACDICCLASASASIDMPKAEAFQVTYRQAARVVWDDQTPHILVPRGRSNIKARAPPL